MPRGAQQSATAMPNLPHAPDPHDGPASAPALSDSDLDALAERIAERVASLPQAPPPLLTSAEVADWLNVAERTVDNLVALGELTPVRVTPSGRGRRFERRAVEAFIRRSAGGRS